MLTKVGQSVLSVVSNQDHSEAVKAIVGISAAVAALTVIGAAIYYSTNKKTQAKKVQETDTWTSIAIATVCYVTIVTVGKIVGQSNPNYKPPKNAPDFVW